MACYDPSLTLDPVSPTVIHIDFQGPALRLRTGRETTRNCDLSHCRITAHKQPSTTTRLNTKRFMAHPQVPHPRCRLELATTYDNRPFTRPGRAGRSFFVTIPGVDQLCARQPSVHR